MISNFNLKEYKEKISEVHQKKEKTVAIMLLRDGNFYGINVKF